ncbi:MAG: hypothetical protein HRF43_01080 [Phycisphaerae bacterium]
MPYDPDADDEGADDRDDPRPEDVAELDRDDEEDEAEWRRCPACGASVLADAPQCPRCGEWLSDETPAERRSRGWLWPVTIAGLIVVLVYLWHGSGR